MPYKDIERRRAYGREWMRANPQKAREAMRRWREKHLELDRAAKRDWYQGSREAESAKRALYARTHPEVQAIRRRNRRALELGAVGSHTTAQWLALVAAYAGRCAYCGAQGPLQADHAVPLSRGGSHFIENIRPACAQCNSRKRMLTEEEFRARLAVEAQGIRRLREASPDQVCGSWLSDAAKDAADGPGLREAPIEWTYDAAG